MSKKQKENIERLKQAIDTLESIAGNPTSPRNIRNTVREIIKSLNDESLGVAVRAANAISTLDDLTQDPNMSSHIRVVLWQVVSTLEGIRD